MPFLGEEYRLDPNWMFLAGVVLLCFVLIRRYLVRTARMRRREGTVAAPKRFDRPDRLSDAPSHVVQWQVEMHEIAREAKAELDSKMRALQVLLRDAAEQEARLRALLAECNQVSQADTKS
jgi:hypothetical protein